MHNTDESKLVRPKVNKILKIVLFIVLLNILISLFLAWQYYFPPESSICTFNATFDCVAVAQSGYGEMFGLSNAIFGIIFYTGLFVGLAGVIWNWPFWKIWKKLRPGVVLDIVRWVSYFGLLFAVYLTYVEVAVIYKYCLFCLIQQVLIIFIVGLLIWVNSIINQGKKETNVCEFC